jgi:hypothetical protein
MRSLVLLALFPLAVTAQITPTLVTTLADEVNETSGLLWIGDDLWTHEDSDCEPKLYRIDRNSGAVLQTVNVNAPNVDWEDITSDEEHVYLGDVGNNGGNRTDLKILRFSRALLEDPSTTEVNVDTIAFAYEDQTSFEFAMNNNDWDCESILAHSDSIYLFTKNWVDHQTRLYSIPAQPGEHLAQLRGSHDVQGLITGAAMEANGERVVLVGYTPAPFVPFVCVLHDYTGTDMLGGEVERATTTLAFVQVEGVEWDGTAGIIFSNEQSPFSQQRLWSLPINTSIATSIAPTGDIQLQPNPANDFLHLSITDPNAEVSVIDALGKEVMRSRYFTGGMDISDLAPGNYQLVVRSEASVRTGSFVVSR